VISNPLTETIQTETIKTETAETATSNQKTPIAGMGGLDSRPAPEVELLLSTMICRPGIDTSNT
jgi:hypothetical protein